MNISGKIGNKKEGDVKKFQTAKGKENTLTSSKHSLLASFGSLPNIRLYGRLLLSPKNL